MANYVIPPRLVGRVLLIEDNRHMLYLGLGNGSVSVLMSEDRYTFPIGAIVLFDPETQDIDQVPTELWQETPWIGVVRHSDGVTAVVERDPSLFQVDVGQVQDLHKGNTVEVHPETGIARIISSTPIQTRLEGESSDISVLPYRSHPGEQALTFADFGGLSNVKLRARELIETPLEHHELLAEIGARPIKGVLFTGGTGTGKTMLARIVASQAGATFYQISGPQIFNKWYGESERIIRDIFRDARDQERAIVFFDEIDSVAGRRAEDTHEASRRVVAQLLTEMDGFRPDANVVVIATTNRPQDIDPALRRPGRFDWEIEFPYPNENDRLEILNVTASRLKVSDRIDHSKMAQATEGWSAAELSAIFSEAALMAVNDRRAEIIYEDYWGGFDRVSVQRNRVDTGRATEAPR